MAYALATLPGFADATPGSVMLDETTNPYTVNITMHVNEAAFDKRFSRRRSSRGQEHDLGHRRRRRHGRDRGTRLDRRRTAAARR